jgi:hypothetical protein
LRRDSSGLFFGQLKRYLPGRKGYNGRVERSLRAFDEEFYRPYLLKMEDEGDFLKIALRWVYFYNVLRPHLSSGDGEEDPFGDFAPFGV